MPVHYTRLRTAADRVRCSARAPRRRTAYEDRRGLPLRRITFEAEVDPEKVTICHCTDCQTLSGAPFRASVPVAVDQFKVSGEPATYVKVAESGNKRVQAFCAHCGTPIFATALENPTLFMLRLGAVRQRDQLVPERQIWTDSQQAWASSSLESIPSLPRQ